MLPIEEAIAPAMKSYGFKKKARTWWRATDDSVQVVNLQKSAYGEQLYINLGLFVRSLGSEQTPPENRCHIRARLERVVPESLYLSVTSASSYAVPSEELVNALLLHGIGWFEKLGSPAGRRSLLNEASSSRWFISKEAREA